MKPKPYIFYKHKTCDTLTLVKLFPFMLMKYKCLGEKRDVPKKVTLKFFEDSSVPRETLSSRVMKYKYLGEKRELYHRKVILKFFEDSVLKNVFHNETKIISKDTEGIIIF